MHFLKLFSLVIFTVSVFGKMDFYIDETVENCAESGEAAEAFDFSKLDFIAKSDTEMIMNGSVNFKKDFDKPWRVFAFTEKFDRGQWNAYAFQRRIEDFCSIIHSPTENFYQYTKDLKGCPLSAGVSFL